MCIKSFISSDSFLSFFLARKSRVFSLFRTGFVWRPNHFDEFYSRIIFLDTFSCGTPAKTQTNTRAPTKQIKMLYFNLSLMWSRENGSGFLLFSLPFFVIVWKIISAKAFRSHQPTNQATKRIPFQLRATRVSLFGGGDGVFVSIFIFICCYCIQRCI